MAAGSTGGSAGPDHGWLTHEADFYERSPSVMKSGHTLAYLDVEWNQIGNPLDWTEGCWRHTFALTGAFVHQELLSERYRLRVFGDEGVGVHVPERYDRQQAVAVGARRIGTSFGTLDRETLSQEIVQQHHESRADEGDADEPADEAGLLEPMRQDPSTIDDAHIPELVEELTGESYESAEDRQNLQREAMGIGIAALGGVDAPEHTNLSRVVNLASKLSTAGDFVDFLEAARTLMKGVDIERFDTGFEGVYPGGEGEEFDDPESSLEHEPGAGGHYMVFDVYVPPDVSATVQVASKSKVRDAALSGAWEIEFDSRPPDVPANADERFVASASPIDGIDRDFMEDS